MKFSDTLSDGLVKCPRCGDQRWHRSSSLWCCGNGHIIKAVSGIPDFSQNQAVSERDMALQVKLYKGILARYYGFMMPLLATPARPISQSLPLWGALLVGWVVAVAIVIGWIANLSPTPGGGLWLFTLMLGLLIVFLNKHRYLFWLLILAVPVKLILMFRPYRPPETFTDVHRKWVNTLKESECGYVLDVSTGTCNSLLRHGWASLNAEFHGVDLSPVMLVQGADNAAQANVAINLYIADAQALPLPDECMDLVLNYGALNAYNDQKLAMSEMARVLKPGGVLVCLDEQLYGKATMLEALYFSHVLAAHDQVHEFPEKAVPDNLVVVENHQIYQFYYLVIMKKQG